MMRSQIELYICILIPVCIAVQYLSILFYVTLLISSVHTRVFPDLQLF